MQVRHSLGAMQQARDDQLGAVGGGLMGGGCTAERIGFTAARLAVQCGLIMAARRMLTSGSVQGRLHLKKAGLAGAQQTSKAGAAGRADTSQSVAAACAVTNEAEIDSAQLVASSASSCSGSNQLQQLSGPQHRQPALAAAAAGSSSEVRRSISGHWPAGKGGGGRFDPLLRQREKPTGTGWLGSSGVKPGERAPLASSGSSGGSWWAVVQDPGWCALLVWLCTPAAMLVSGR